MDQPARVAASPGDASLKSREAAQQRGLLQSVGNAIDVLALFDVRRPAWTLTEIVRETGMDQATAFRLLSTLEAKGVLSRRSRTDPYRVAIKLWQIGRSATARAGLAATAPVFLSRLTEVTGETAYCGVVDGRNITEIDVYLAPGRLKVSSYPHPIGTLSPLHTTAMGKAILAAGSDEALGAYIAGGLERLTLRTITDPDQFRAEIATVRELGYGSNIEESLVGEISIGAAILADDDEVIAAISVTGPSLWELDRHPVIGEQVKQVANEATLLLKQHAYAYPQFQ
jgi:DNA-binding IclR family transcriptional regulator